MIVLFVLLTLMNCAGASEPLRVQSNGGCVRVEKNSYIEASNVYEFVKGMAHSHAFTIQFWTRRSWGPIYDAHQTCLLNIVFHPTNVFSTGILFLYGSISVMGAWFDTIAIDDYVHTDWVHLSFRFKEVDPSLSNLEGRFYFDLFVDGMFIGQTNNAATADNDMNFANLLECTDTRIQFGMEQRPFGTYGSVVYDGWFDDLRVWSTFLPEAEVTQWWAHAPQPRSGVNISQLMYWPLDTVAMPDVIGTANPMTFETVTCSSVPPRYALGCAPVWTTANATVMLPVGNKTGEVNVITNSTAATLTLRVVSLPGSGTLRLNGGPITSGMQVQNQFQLNYNTTILVGTLTQIDEAVFTVEDLTGSVKVTVKIFALPYTDIPTINADVYEGTATPIALTQHLGGVMPVNVITSLPERGRLSDACDKANVTSVPYTLSCANIEYHADLGSVSRFVYNFTYETRPALNTSLAVAAAVVRLNILHMDQPAIPLIPIEVEMDEDSEFILPIRVHDADSAITSFEFVGTGWSLTENVTVFVREHGAADELQLRAVIEDDREDVVESFAKHVVAVTPGSPVEGVYSAEMFLGPPDQHLSASGEYIDYGLGTPSCADLADKGDIFFSEFVRFRTAEKMVPFHFFLDEVENLGRTARVKAFDPVTKHWYTLWSQSKPQEKQIGSRKFAPFSCQTPFLTDEFQVDKDSCAMGGSLGYDSILLTGRTKKYAKIVRNGSFVKFKPTKNYFGRTNYTYRVTDCVGDPFRQQVSYFVLTVRPINDAPDRINSTIIINNTAPSLTFLPASDVDTSALLIRIRSIPPGLAVFSLAHTSVLLEGSVYNAARPIQISLKRPEMCGRNQAEMVLEYDVIEDNCIACLESRSRIRVESRCEECPDRFIYITTTRTCEICPPPSTYQNGACVYIPQSSNVGIIVPSVICGVLFVAGAIVALLYFHRRRSRNSRILESFPPGKFSNQVTLVFTDIEGSTKLWDSVGVHMYTSLSIHNKIIRATLERHKGREVKTIGDSFMIAFWNPVDALGFMLEAQLELVAADWPAEIMGHELCMEILDDRANTIFRGLRVRMGCHMGECEREIIKGTEGVDYFGHTVNVAARVESIARGGQILVTDAVREMVQTDTTTSLTISSRGSHKLKGVSRALEVFEIMPIELHSRTFVNTFQEPLDSSTEVNGVCISCRRPCHHCHKRLSHDPAIVVQTQGQSRPRRGTTASDALSIHSAY